MYFMMTSYFWNQNLNFSKVKYETYKGHTFFVDWGISNIVSGSKL